MGRVTTLPSEFPLLHSKLFKQDESVAPTVMMQIQFRLAFCCDHLYYPSVKTLHDGESIVLYHRQLSRVDVTSMLNPSVRSRKAVLAKSGRPDAACAKTRVDRLMQLTLHRQIQQPFDHY